MINYIYMINFITQSKPYKPSLYCISLPSKHFLIFLGTCSSTSTALFCMILTFLFLYKCMCNVHGIWQQSTLSILALSIPDSLLKVSQCSKGDQLLPPKSLAAHVCAFMPMDLSTRKHLRVHIQPLLLFCKWRSLCVSDMKWPAQASRQMVDTRLGHRLTPQLWAFHTESSGYQGLVWSRVWPDHSMNIRILLIRSQSHSNGDCTKVWTPGVGDHEGTPHSLSTTVVVEYVRTFLGCGVSLLLSNDS